MPATSADNSILATGRPVRIPTPDDPSGFPNYYRNFRLTTLGIGHYFAAVLIAWDKDSDIIHVTHGFKIKDATPSVHVPMMRAIAPDVPVAWPHDGNARDKGSGEPIVELYLQPMPGMPGLNMLDEHAQFEAGGYQTEAIVLEVIERLQSGRLKINAHLVDLWAVYREYHRDKEGRLVHVRDDLLSALFKAIMMKRCARAGGLGSTNGGRSRGYWKSHHDQVSGSDFDLFTGQPRYESQS